jgi:hypothetical protein
MSDEKWTVIELSIESQTEETSDGRNSMVSIIGDDSRIVADFYHLDDANRAVNAISEILRLRKVIKDAPCGCVIGKKVLICDEYHSHNTECFRVIKEHDSDCWKHKALEGES